MKIFKSYGFWTALSGALVMLINAIGKCFGFSVEEQIISDIVMAVAGVLVVFGVVAMPKGENTKKEQDENQTETDEKENDETEKLQNEQLEQEHDEKNDELNK